MRGFTPWTGAGGRKNRVGNGHARSVGVVPAALDNSVPDARQAASGNALVVLARTEVRPARSNTSSAR